MKKVLCAVLLVVVTAGCAFAGHKVGMCIKNYMTPEEFTNFIKTKFDQLLIQSGETEAPEFVFYDSLTAMLLALDKGEVDEIAEHEDVANYLLNSNPDFLINCVIISRKFPLLLSFGFKAGREELQKEFNDALLSMKRDGTLPTLHARYINPNTMMLEERFITDPNANIIEPVVFAKFDDAETIKVAVTGDLPPIDYIDADGTPEGFSVAVIAEIGRRIHKNIEILNIEAGARVAALMSGRADAVFWFESVRGVDERIDTPESVILSEPYYECNTDYHLKKAD